MQPLLGRLTRRAGRRWQTNGRRKRALTVTRTQKDKHRQGQAGSCDFMACGDIPNGNWGNPHLAHCMATPAAGRSAVRWRPNAARRTSSAGAGRCRVRASAAACAAQIDVHVLQPCATTHTRVITHRNNNIAETKITPHASRMGQQHAPEIIDQRQRCSPTRSGVRASSSEARGAASLRRRDPLRASGCGNTHQ